MTGPVPEPVFTETLQVAIVVRDLDAAMRTYVHEYGIGPWEIYEFNPDEREGHGPGRPARRVCDAASPSPWSAARSGS